MMYPVLFIRKDNRHLKVPVQDILYLHAAGSYSHLVTTTEEFSLSLNLSQFIRKNNVAVLVRVHRSYLVNVQHIDSFDQSFVYLGNTKIPIGEKYRQVLKEGIKLI